MSQETEMLLAQAQSLHTTVKALKDMALNGEFLCELEAKLQCLQGWQQRFSATFASAQQTLKTREQHDKAQQTFKSFWDLTSETEYDLRLWMSRTNQYLANIKSEAGGGRQDSVINAMKELVSAMQGQSRSKVKLPQLQIPSFSGKYTEWQSFSDSFVSTIHTNRDLSAVDKFTYLKAALTGNAASALKHLPVSEANYAEAWSILQNRFNKPSSIVAEFVTTFHAQPHLPHPDAGKLRGMFNTFEEVTHGLKAMEQLHHDPFMIHSALQMVDPETRTLWYRETTEKPQVTWAQFCEFLAKRCDSLELGAASDSAHAPANAIQPPKESAKKNTNSLVTFNQEGQGSLACDFCQQLHKTHRCPTFLSKIPAERYSTVANLKLCWNCLRPNHFLKDCSSGGCRQCGQRHNTLLHDAFQGNMNFEVSGQQNENNPSSNLCASNPSSNQTTQNSLSFSTMVSQDLTSLAANQSHQVLLPTVQVLVADLWGNQHRCRALIDSCSQPNCISRNLAQKLALPKKNSGQNINGLGMSGVTSSQTVDISLQSHCSPFSMGIECSVLERITGNQPSTMINRDALVIPHDIQLADPDFYKPGSIDLLLGSEVFAKAVRSNHRSGSPMFLDTAFGFVVIGDCPGTAQTTVHSHMATSLCVTQPWDKQASELNSVWPINTNSMSQRRFNSSEQRCEYQNIPRTTNYLSHVHLPARDRLHHQGNSKEIAKKNPPAKHKSHSGNNQARQSRTHDHSSWTQQPHNSLPPRRDLFRNLHFCPARMDPRQRHISARIGNGRVPPINGQKPVK
ncbi:uncharacterized protein LOC129788679 [Lutzomyia longipalpis]|uniref:uncharacterized protein LOC129788679 n=1 Tax=Lutzomyia longipalpis TaxID=7200 RepID=UPI00248341C3|nr:uncharacterized protein LOC129788679 [Lutzomyia longipalpis]